MYGQHAFINVTVYTDWDDNTKEKCVKENIIEFVTNFGRSAEMKVVFCSMHIRLTSIVLNSKRILD